METNDLVENHASKNEDEFEINTGRIFSNEGDYAREGEEYLAKKCPDRLADSLELTIRSLLEKHTNPSMSSTNLSDNYLELKYEKLASGEMGHLQMQNFKVDHFVLKLEQPIEEPSQPSRVGKPDKYFYYLFEFREPLGITKKMVDEETFELLFAFALRQCNLTYLNKFLEYHLDKNFEGDLKKFIGFLVLIKRKFEEPLFSNGLIDATDNWVKEWEIDLKDSGGEKIKAHLSVEQLAFIFRALHECKLIEGNNAKLIGRVVSRAFNSKAKEDLSPGNLSKKYYELSDDTVEFWLYQFSKMEAFAKRQLEKK